MTTDKREARRQYKERKTPKGIFAVRCASTGQVWTGSSTHLDSEQNSLWFQLEKGHHLNPGLDAAWKEHGRPAFSYEVLETLDDDLPPLAVNDTLKRRLAHWREALGALKV
ncbi:MAG: GIY-YIG nuclease family protein [Bryobacterales bacterium]|nr:GIY-YIG nuclease family protein [Bryobacterales bacterium]